MSANSQAKPPFGPPDCPWRPITSDKVIPETAVYKNGKLDGEDVYIGRVYDGNSLLVGTVIPKKGICIYLDKNCNLKSSSNYEILTVDCGDPLSFENMDIDNENIFVAGSDENGKTLYVGRIITSNNDTYYGWVSKTSRSVYIPRDSNMGPQVLDTDFAVLIHKFLDRLCICPPCLPCPPNTA